MRLRNVIIAAVLAAPLPASAALAPGGTFADDDASVHEADIEALAAAGITEGCGEVSYCPGDPVSRAQMASFLVRSVPTLPPAPGDAFFDDDGSVHEVDIDRLAAGGVTRGCGPHVYCPRELVTRGQMAAFLARVLRLPPSTEDAFVDDDGSLFEADIQAVAAAGIAKGCGGGSFCPEEPVTRGQMASLLVRALGLAPIEPPPRDLLAVELGDGRIVVIDWEAQPWGGLPGGGADPDWAPDGTRLAVVREGRVVVVDLDGAPLVILGRGWDPDWDSEGVRVAYVGGTPIAVLVDDLSGAAPTVAFPGGLAIPEAPVWSLGGPFLTFHRGHLHAAGLEFFTWVVGPDGPEVELRGADPTWIPGSTELVYSAGCEVLNDVWRQGHLASLGYDGSGEVVITTPSDGSCDRHPDVGPDGGSIAYVRVTHESSEVRVVQRDGSGDRVLYRDGADPTWSPDGSRVAFLEDGILWTIAADGSDLRVLHDEVVDFDVFR